MKISSWLFLFSLIGAIAGLTSILSFLGITPKPQNWRWPMLDENGWLLWLAIIFFVGTIISSSVGWYLVTHPKPIDYGWDEYKFEIIEDKTFRNEVVVLDGKRFINCNFYNITFEYNGNAPVQMIDVKIGGINIKSENPSIQTMMKIFKELKVFDEKVNFY